MIVRFGLCSIPARFYHGLLCHTPHVMLLISLVLLLSPMTQEANPNIACKTSLTTEATQPELTANGKMRCSDGAIVDYEDMHVETGWMEYDPVTKVLTAGDQVH